MAKRMFCSQIVDSDAFLDMSPTAQNLYFHLGMRADDDGFVGNSKKILRMVGGNEDDFKILLLKRFILAFENGVIVIKHWRMNNYLRKDIYQPTQYPELKSQLFIKNNGAYTLDSTKGVPVPLSHFTLEDIDKITCTRRIQDVHLGKVRIGKDRKEEKPTASINYLKSIPSEDLKEFITRFVANERQIKSKAEDLILYCKSKAKIYKDYKAFLLNALKRDFEERVIRPLSTLSKPKEEVIYTPEQLKKIAEEKARINEIMRIKL